VAPAAGCREAPGGGGHPESGAGVTLVRRAAASPRGCSEALAAVPRVPGTGSAAADGVKDPWLPGGGVSVP
jgi:hypothetical protein